MRGLVAGLARLEPPDRQQAVLYDLCFMLTLMLLGLSPALGLVLLRLWSRTRPRTLVLSRPEVSALLRELDARLNAVGLGRAGKATLPIVYTPNALRRGIGALPVTLEWAGPDRARLSGPSQLLTRLSRLMAGARLEASTAPWAFRRTARWVGGGYLGVLGVLALALGALWSLDALHRQPDGTSPNDVVVTLSLTPAEARAPLQRNLWVAEAGRFVFVSSPGGLTDGQRLRFPRKGRSTSVTRTGDLTVVVEVK